MDYCFTTKTLAGHRLDNKLPNSGIKLELVRAMTGAGKVPLEQLESLTEITDPVQEAYLQEPIASSVDTELTVPVKVRNAGMQEDYEMFQLGVYAKDPDLGEILYLVMQIDREVGETILAESSSPAFTVDFDLVIKVMNAKEVVVNVREAGSLTAEQADARYVKKSDIEYIQTTLSAANWNTETKIYSFEETYPSDQYHIELEAVRRCTPEQQQAWAKAIPMGSDEENVLEAFGEVPTVDIPILLTVRKIGGGTDAEGE